jgi:arsenate reductase
MATVLFVCLHNAGRSQMSQALFERAMMGATTRAARGRHQARSAGTTPAERVHPEVIVVMQELGIDLSDRRPQLLTTELAAEADVVVTMGCGDACPYIPGKRYIDWELPDPKGRPLDEVRAIRDEIDRRVGLLLTDGVDVLPGPARVPSARVAGSAAGGETVGGL